ncbi:hypothetical protein Taro_039694 [Colocasia esculenta]|uniref:Glucose-6-phosphate dehydrogenase (NADP(+)) n=1 Tax=Colocasia esculenta TaxID=4460 RepID=A0A843W9Z0_COLES|nr:hypothetical protein [Colocasia esculenta]
MALSITAAATPGHTRAWPSSAIAARRGMPLAQVTSVHFKSVRRYVGGKKSKKLVIQGSNHSPDHTDIPVTSEILIPNKIPDIMNDSAEEMSSTSQTVSENSTSGQPDNSNNAVQPVNPPVMEETFSYSFDHLGSRLPSLCIAVIGATGELARSKVFPALFALYYSGFLPENVGIIGYSRKQLTNNDLRDLIAETLTCRVDHRIDHLLGKDLIENLTVLRFSNLVFEPLWSRTYIRNVQVILSEDCGIETRRRYFDGYGIIRDVVHSHILQTIALFAMEPPVSLNGEDIRNEKVKVLRSLRKLELDDVVLGQHKANSSMKHDEYLNSLTPTFFAAALYIDNARWDGVPFLIKAGMGLIKHRVEIRIQFNHVPGNLYRERIGHNIDLTTNELILRDVPDEAIFLKINNKVPGLGLQLDASELNLLYRDKYNVEIPDSYEHLLLDVIDGDSHLFLRSDELEAAWNILTPVLHEIDENKISPELYEFGGRGPVGAYYLGAKHGVRWADD